MTGFQRREREWWERGKIGLPKAVANGGDGGFWNQVQEQQSATTLWGCSVDLGTDWGRSIQKTKGHAEFIGSDPRSPEISVHRSKEARTVANGQTGFQRGFTRKLFIPVAEQLVAAAVVDPANGAHARNPSGNLRDEQSHVVVGRANAAVTFEVSEDSRLQACWREFCIPI